MTSIHFSSYVSTVLPVSLSQENKLGERRGRTGQVNKAEVGDLCDSNFTHLVQRFQMGCHPALAEILETCGVMFCPSDQNIYVGSCISGLAFFFFQNNLKRCTVRGMFSHFSFYEVSIRLSSCLSGAEYLWSWDYHGGHVPMLN